MAPRQTRTLEEHGVLRWRILLGVTLIAALAGLLWLDLATRPGACVLALALVVGMAAAHEAASIVLATGHQPLLGVIYGGTALVILSNAIPIFWTPPADDQPLERLGWPMLAFALSLLAAFIGEMSRYKKPGEVLVNIALTMLAIAYVGVLLSFTLQLRMLGGPVTGMVALVAMLLVVKMGDTGAYTVGRLIGRHKMAPVISPGKTMEGAVGAIASSCLASWFAFTHLAAWMGANTPDRVWGWIVFGVVVGGAGMLGDLAESLMKRDVGAKDSSAWLPGFGGILDLLDSILFASPVAYLCALLEMT
jgi:phosphatidate cytidylyltransferase